MTQIIGIAGLAGSGKDTLAEYLSESGAGYEIDTFAAPIRTIAARLGLCIYDREAKEKEAIIRFEHFEVSLVEAVVSVLGDWLGEEDLCDLYAHLATILRSRGYLSTGRQDVLTISPRRFCQLLGTEAGRQVRGSLWIDLLRSRAKRSRAKVLLVPDVRFTNEALVCDKLIGIQRPGVVAVSAHESELAAEALVQGADYIVVNNGTLHDLLNHARNIHSEIQEGSL